jgi:hypothetical protein
MFFMQKLIDFLNQPLDLTLGRGLLILTVGIVTSMVAKSLSSKRG